mgnify:CR=1 FL=1
MRRKDFLRQMNEINHFSWSYDEQRVQVAAKYDQKILEIHEQVKNYYGKELEKSEDLKTNACCSLVEPPQYIKDVLAKIHDEVMAKYYGCGLTIPDKLKGLKVLDLGCGSGRDVYIASQLVGESGSVIGLDMTDEQ